MYCTAYQRVILRDVPYLLIVTKALSKRKKPRQTYSENYEITEILRVFSLRDMSV